MSGPRTYLLATRSEGKLRELRRLFQHRGLDVIDLREADVPPSPKEDEIEAFETFEENARAKADYFHHLSGLPTLADDSGLVVHALQGRPGVRSKRWSGRTDLAGEALDAANNLKLLQELAATLVPPPWAAEYVCAAAFTDERTTLTRLGQTTGSILPEARGRGGFGYDPYFLSDELGKSFGEADTSEKNVISHRGRAFSRVLDALTATPVGNAK